MKINSSNKMKYLLGFIIFLLAFQTGFSQEGSEIPFVRHLINKGYYKEAIHLIEKDTLYCGKQQKDSLYYFHGWAHYSLKNLEQSTLSLLEVGKESPFYKKSHFFAGYNQIYLENYFEAREIFNQMDIQNEPELSLLNFELSGMEILQGNWQEAEEQLRMINQNNAALNQQVIALEEICKEHAVHRAKSPVLAGIMSGIIPGSGKIYAGKTGAGIASMIGTVGFGLIAWENYHKLGISNAKTIIFGSIFAASYVSNIYGSVISVKVIENEYKNTVHNQVLFQLHIPLRNFFE
jgi:tetratricopeptide (TPR) repeat protein